MAEATVMVPDDRELEVAVASYVAQGFMVVNRTGSAATLRKPKQFNVAIALVGLLFCGIGLLVYAIVYNGQSDQVVEIRVAAPEAAVALSEDGRWWWDGGRWRPVPAAERPPPSGSAPPPPAGA